jgi:HSP20 family molecular chaperone IbpA
MYKRLPTRDGFTAGILEDIDKFFNDFMRPYATDSFCTYGKSQSPKLNAYRKNGKYNLEVFVPLAKKEDIDVEINERTLRVSVANRQDKDVTAADYIIREVSRGASTRELSLGEDIDVDSTKVNFKDGVLYITFDAVEQKSKVKKIEIK